MSEMLTQINQELQRMADPERAEKSQRYFKTGPGEYGEGDVFIGIRVPLLRALARRFRDASREDALTLLHSEIHEARLTALFLMVQLYQRRKPDLKQEIYQDYLANMRYINNWDLVDSSASQIVGRHLFDRDRRHLRTLAHSNNLWERRVAIIATAYYIKENEFQDTLDIAEILLNDKEDLIHKGVGWMLREVGEKSRPTEEGFLKKHYKQMPRTMLRYAIEKFPEPLRQAYLKGEI